MRKVLNNIYFLFFLLFPFFNPTSLQYITSTKTLYSLMQYWKLLSIIIIISIYILRNRYSGMVFLITLFEFSLIFSSIINGVVDSKVFTNALLAVGISMITDIMLQIDYKKYITMLLFISVSMLIVNFVLCLLFPRGLTFAQLYKSVRNPLYFLGLDNGMIKNIILPVMLSNIICNETKKYYLYYFVSLISLVTLVIVQSATGILTFVFLFIYLCLFNFKLKKRMNYLVYVSFYIIFTLLVVILGGSMEKFSSAFSYLGRSMTFTGRTQLWSAAVELIQKKPMLGYGYTAGNISIWGGQFSSHNLLLEILLQGGIISFGIFLLILIIAIKKIIYGNRSVSNTVFLAIFSFLLVGLMEVGLHWSFFVLIILSSYTELGNKGNMKYIVIKKKD